MQPSDQAEDVTLARANTPTSQKGALSVRVAAITREAEGIASFELVDPHGGSLPSFAAGAHIDMHLPGGLIRQYSLCNDPKERHRYIIAVLREPNGRGGSALMHDAVKQDHIMRISEPRNNFPLAGREANFHLLLAGGIGITPIMAMIAELETRGDDYLLHYCTRSLERTAFLQRLEPLIAEGKAILHQDGGDPSRGLDIAATLAEHSPGKHVYVCGPAGLMAAAKNSAGSWPPHAVHFEQPNQRKAHHLREEGQLFLHVRRHDCDMMDAVGLLDSHDPSSSVCPEPNQPCAVGKGRKGA